MKKLLSILLILALTLSLAACGGSDDSSSSSEAGDPSSSSEADNGAEETIKIAFFMFENSNTFTTYIRKGLEDYGSQVGVEVESFDGKSDQATQTDAITTALAKGGYDLIVVNPVDSGAGETINDIAEQHGVAVIYADRAPDLVGGILDDYEDAYYVGLDWSDPGAVQADMVKEYWEANMETMDKNGDGVLQYVLLQGNIAQQNAIYRTQAIHDSFEAWNADGSLPTEELDIQDGNWSADKGKEVMDTWNVKYGDEIEAVLCNNDTMAMGAIESIKTTGKFDDGTAPIVFGINAIPDVWSLLEEGTMAGTVLTSPYREAVAIIDMTKNIVAGNDPLEGTELEWGEFGKDVRIDNVAITTENIDVAEADYIID